MLEECLAPSVKHDGGNVWKGTLNKGRLHFHGWINCVNKLTLNDGAVSYIFTLFIRGGPCHVSSFKQCSGDLIILWEQLVYSFVCCGEVWIFLSVYYYLINIVHLLQFLLQSNMVPLKNSKWASPSQRLFLWHKLLHGPVVLFACGEEHEEPSQGLCSHISP